MLVRRGGVLVRVTAMLMRRRRVLFRFSMPPMFVIVRGFAVMMRSAFVMRRRLMMMFAGGMFCFGHDVSSLRLSALSRGQYPLGDARRRIQRAIFTSACPSATTLSVAVSRAVDPCIVIGVVAAHVAE
jgi:hypothetical protein